MLRFIAYGEELNLIHPPKPKDPRKPWNPLWSVKVRLKSAGMTTLMAAGDEHNRKSRPDRNGKQQDEGTGESKTPDSDSGLLLNPVKKLKGLFRF
jgi:hypothetical protein